jgi:hypothetical protein
MLSLFRNYGATPDCTRLVDVNKFVNILVNCDSATFMKDAQEPVRLFNGVSDYQDRPIYSLLAAIINELLNLLPIPSQEFKIFGNSGTWHVYTSNVFLSFIVINCFLLFVATYLTIKVISQCLESCNFSEINNSLFIIFGVALITLNEITKTFFWTPHTQIPNVIIPIYAIYLILNHELFAQRNFVYKHLTFISIGIFVYPFIGILLLIPFFISLQSWKFRVFSCSLAAIPYLSYPIIVELFGGQFRNVTINKFRQFIWVLDVAESEEPLSALLSFIHSFLATVPILPTVFVLSTFTVIFLKDMTLEYLRSYFWRSTIYFGLFYAFFTFFIGFYARRLTYGVMLYFIALAFLAIVRTIPNVRHLTGVLTSAISTLILIFLLSNGAMA